MTEADPDGSETEYESSTTRFGYSDIGNLVLIVNPDDTTQSGVYHSTYNRVTQWTDELLKSESFTYYTNSANGPDGTLSRYTDAGGIYVDYRYDLFGNLVEEKTQDPDGGPNGNSQLMTQYAYGSNLQLSEIRLNGDLLREFTYNDADQIATVTDWFDSNHSRVTTYVHDPLDRLVETTLADPDGSGPLSSPVYTYAYAANLLLESETDPLGNTTDYGYHETRHFLTSMTLPDPDDTGTTNGPLSRPQTTFEYYANGWLQKEFRPEFNDGTTALFLDYSYDAGGNLTQIAGPLAGQTESRSYELTGRLESVTDASGRIVTYRYDSRHRVIEIIDHDPDGEGPLTGPTTSYAYDDAGRIQQVTDPLGRYLYYVYYDNGLLAKSLVQDPNPVASDPLGGGGGFGLPGGNMGPTGGDAAVPDGMQATLYEYDYLNRLVNTVDPSGRVTTNVYNQRGQLVEVRDPDPNPEDADDTRPSTLYEHDWQNRVLAVTDVLGRITQYDLDDLDRITQVTLPDPDDYGTGNNGPQTSPWYRFEYDAVGNLVKTTDSLNRYRITQYDNLYRTIHTTESIANTRFSFGVQQHGADWYISYNDQLQIASMTDPAGAVTSRGYDNAARLTSLTQQLGSDDLVTTYSYDLLNRIDTVTGPDPDNAPGGDEPRVTSYGYDIYSRLTSITDADGTITQRYNDAGELIAVIDQLGNTTSYAYDLLGRRSLESDAMGATTSHLYNIHGRLVRQVDRLGQIVWYGQEGYDSREMWFQYGPGVVPPAIDVATTTEGGSGFDEVQTVTVHAGADGRFRLAFGGETTFYLDYGADPGVVQAALQAMHAIDNVDVARSGDSANGYTYTITFGGTLADTDVDPLLADVAADSDGEIVRIIDYGFDAGGRLLSVADYDPGADLESDIDDTPLSADYVWTYDQLDRVLTQHETIAGLNPAIELASTWDRVNRRTSLAATIGGVADYRNTYAYDFENKPQWIYQQSQSGGHAVAYKRIEFRYNDIGQLTYVNRFETSSTSLGTPSLRSVFEYDDANRLLTLSHKAAEHAVGVDVLAQYDYEYDFAGRITAIDSLIDGRSEFSFSTTDQLTDADHDVHGSASNHNPNEAYTYDANGNRIGSGFIVDAQNRTMSDGVYDYEYDAEGNRIRRTLIADGSYEVNTFDHRHRLVRVDFYNASDVLQQSVTYAYDAFNRMVRRSVDDDGDGHADRDQYFAGFDGDNSTLEFDGPDVGDLAHRRLWGPFIDQLIASEQVDSLTDPGDVDWPVTDHTGTIRDVARLDDVSGDFLIASHRVYSSFGLLTDEYAPATGTASGIDLDYGFTARFTDPLTGMTHHQFRWYDAHLGKWISEDPLGFAAGDINTTRYVANAPLTYTDPTGLIAVNIGDGNDDSRHGGDGFWGNLWGNVKNFGVATKVIGTALWHQDAGWIGGNNGDFTDQGFNAVSAVGDSLSLGASYMIRRQDMLGFGDRINYDGNVYRVTMAGTTAVEVFIGVGIVKNGFKHGGKAVLRNLDEVAPKNVTRYFNGDEAIQHFNRHGSELSDVLGRSSYNLKNYLDDANHVINNGTFVPELNGYVRLIGGKGSAKYAFVGMERGTNRITTFHIKTVKELIKKAPSLGLSK